jgi:membrane-associated phospholipid phosphatase
MDGGEPKHKMTIDAVFDYAGFFAPEIMIAIVTLALWGRTKFLLFYYLFWALDWNWLNAQLKMYFKQSRPAGYNADNSPTAKYETFQHGHSYGMPSGHASIAFYSLTFLLLCVPTFTPYSMAGIAIVAISLFQRFKTKRHTTEQLAAGALEGIVVANVAHWVASHMIISGLY